MILPPPAILRKFWKAFALDNFVTKLQYIIAFPQSSFIFISLQESRVTLSLSPGQRHPGRCLEDAWGHSTDQWWVSGTLCSRSSWQRGNQHWPSHSPVHLLFPLYATGWSGHWRPFCSLRCHFCGQASYHAKTSSN